MEVERVQQLGPKKRSGWLSVRVGKRGSHEAKDQEHLGTTYVCLSAGGIRLCVLSRKRPWVEEG